MPYTQVLYLYDNQISLIENVAPLRRLTHLYLTSNNIREISGLAGLPNLQKLYIEKNCLTVCGCGCVAHRHCICVLKSTRKAYVCVSV